MDVWLLDCLPPGLSNNVLKIVWTSFANLKSSWYCHFADRKAFCHKRVNNGQ